jgi:hemoglobin
VRVNAEIRIAAALVLMLVVAPLAMAGKEGEPTTAEKMSALEAGCAETAEARQQRHAEKPLFERLGGYDEVLELTREVVRLHKQNESIKHMFADVDSEALAVSVADFVSTGTGGEKRYQGRDMVSAHSHLGLTDADFLSAGGDIVTAMQSKGYGAEEIDEMVCILVSLKDQVVLE